ncbi:MAG: MFS transporter [Prevotellaceae bacterium]|nr:MFS transporter [Bacteroidaceae bacterium]MCI6518243.1 MFS transporter [Prevotellaceae bacterium]MDD7376373.1 MFS transporter [Prevotellaceae bacterium]MDY4759972.1 MFS transporter [Bacteroidaceae bacterium]PWL77732.1 MAG: MFS transporter [Prevotellaceae bacterium]
MAQKTKQWAAIVMMVALFAMIAFVTNLCSPMAVIVQNQFGASEFQSQIGNYANFIAYLVMGIPSGMLIVKFGYKKTALLALIVGIIGMVLELLSGTLESMWIYLLGAFIAGFCMCMLNTVVNPLLNVLGGGGNTGNQLIQIGGAFNSAAAVAVYIILGALIGEVTKDTAIVDAAPAMYIALGIFVAAFIVLFFTKIEEPKQEPVKAELIKGALSHRHFALGALAIFLYMSVEVGTPTYMIKYLISDVGISAGVASLIAAVYWFAMFIGRSIGGSIGGKVSSRAMVSTVAIAAIILLAFGMLAPSTLTVQVPGVDWANLSVIWVDVPVGVAAFICVGLCTSVMWGGIFNMAVEGLGKYTAAASGIFMTMVFGCAIMVALQAVVAEQTGSYLVSYIIPLACAAYILFYALVGSRVKKTEAE